MKIEELKEKNVHVVGTSGVEGETIIRFLYKNGVTNITAHDFILKDDFALNFLKFHSLMPKAVRVDIFNELRSLPINFNFKDKYLDKIEEADIIFASQGWIKKEINFPKLKQAKDSGIAFSSMLDLYFSLSKAKIVAVTGTNGKSTTSRIIDAILEKSTLGHYFAGNDRANVQVLDHLHQFNPEDILLLEVSDRQLMIDIKKGPFVGVLTNITPNHLDDHGTFENYIKVKKTLFDHQTGSDFAVLNSDDEISMEISASVPSQVYFYSLKKPVDKGVWVSGGNIVWAENGEIICNVNDIKLMGNHNIENVLASILTAKILGVKNNQIKEAVSNFTGIENRLNLVFNKEFKVYDDLQSTSPQATLKALEVFEDPVLILGGDNKNLDYTDLAAEINKRNLKVVILPGTASDELMEKLTISFTLATDFKDALLKIKDSLKNGDIVLVSPGAAYFSKYLNGKGVKEISEETL
ncbi:MAG: UDP-N-acetylmuramoylalanine-D-glutamate ligase [candidate division CPR2 bacterium GW2011_GWC1_39_9]|nr:MAG: UDP-N-acetylmuramoylalanine-D-glutamate ligase [candidate division CPR2 bacterium GW2011_GWC1_39_9]